MIITKTPYRLSLFGGGTDYRPWFEKKGGLIIAAAMARYCYISIRKLPPFFEHKSRVVYSKIESVLDHQEFVHPSIRKCLEYLNFEQGVEIHHDGDLPAKSGIGSSSSFTVGLLNALHALSYEMKSVDQLAAEAIHVEQNLIKEDVGIQDQIMAAHGGLKILKMGPGTDYTVTPLILAPDYLRALEDHILLGFSGISRFSVEFAKAQIENINNGSSEQRLSEIHSIAEEALDLFKNQSNLDKIGALLDRSWKMKRQLIKGMSNDTIDDIYEIAKKEGAFGGKLLGAGGGGFFALLAPPYRHNGIKSALKKIKVWVPFQIDKSGTQIIFHNSDNH
jgi:D-glycero-alpha-D-manno-heptose-7-phosphate kinase